ncbi:hypothetical protein EVAR_63153_1 [Eumeta japonica]|uniref:Uncharacterized protein n=1 Tax=Eumeta variegata TaxID=151549 RepID=A0A4C1ZY53_EUMVA|nr:hypothetical protein EVAR_63153_1 [Eumeta japonica]
MFIGQLASARGFARVDFKHIHLSYVLTVYDLNPNPDFDTDQSLTFNSEPSVALSRLGLKGPALISDLGTRSDLRNLVYRLSSVAHVYGGSRIHFFHTRKSGCPISGYADGGLEVHSVPLLRQPQPATFLLTYLPALPTAELLSRALSAATVSRNSVTKIKPNTPHSTYPCSSAERSLNVYAYGTTIRSTHGSRRAAPKSDEYDEEQDREPGPELKLRTGRKRKLSFITGIRIQRASGVEIKNNIKTRIDLDGQDRTSIWTKP